MANKKDRVLSFVQSNPGRTQQEISRALNIPPYTGQGVNPILRKLTTEGLIKRERQKRSYKYYPVSTSVQASAQLQHPEDNEEDMLKNCTKENLLIVVSCSKQKVWGEENWGPAYVPAIHAYTGDDVTWLRNNVPKGRGFHCLILSAKYGFIEPEHPIHNYNVTFNEPETGPISADSLKNQVCCQCRLFSGKEKKLSEFRYVLVKGSDTYVKKTQAAFDSIAVVQKLTDELWNKIVANLGTKVGS